MSAIDAACRKDHYPAYHKDGTRLLSAIKWIVLHDTEGGSAAGVALYFQSPNAGGSTHLVVDDIECQRCLPNTAIPRGAPGANTQGFHIEQCGYARWSAVIWRKHLRTLKRAAYKTAYHCRKFSIPPTFIFAADLKAGRRGVTTHLECTKAFGGSHTDPGPGWPRSLFMFYVRRYYKELAPDGAF